MEDHREVIQDLEEQVCRMNLDSRVDYDGLSLDESSSVPTPLDPDTTIKLQVTKSTKFIEAHDQLSQDLKLYPTRGPNRGLMIMFSYSEFLTGQEYRDVESDCEMVKDLFSQFNFKVVTHSDLSKEDTLEVMKGLSPAGYECVFVVVSSHGYERLGMWDTEFSCHDGGMIPVYDVVDIFNNLNYPELEGVPKVFIFQMCRGTKSLSDGPAVTDSATFVGDGEPRATRSPAVFSDVLIAYSTLPGYESVRNIGDSKGSLYMQALCEVFAAHAHRHHVITLFRLVNGALKSLCPTAKAMFEDWGFGDLYLHPGLVEDTDPTET